METTACFLAFMACFAAATANPTQCYTCSGQLDCSKGTNTTLKGALCNVPQHIKIDQADERTFEGQLLRKLQQGIDSKQTDGTCLKLTFSHDYVKDTNFGVRGCYPKELMGQSLCEFAEKAIGIINGVLQDCSTCDEDLCNSSIRISETTRNSFLLSCLALFYLTAF